MRPRLTFPFIFVLVVASAQTAVDTTHAQTMVKLLHDCHTRDVPTSEIEEVMLLPGTQLIMAQQNISRRISNAQ